MQESQFRSLLSTPVTDLDLLQFLHWTAIRLQQKLNHSVLQIFDQQIEECDTETVLSNAVINIINQLVTLSSISAILDKYQHKLTLLPDWNADCRLEFVSSCAGCRYGHPSQIQHMGPGGCMSGEVNALD